MGEERTIEIASIGAQGHGVADTPEGRVYVRYALPGERWRIAADGTAEPVTASEARASPVCRHFGTCGGCIAQHMPPEMYRDWKQAIVTQAFAHRGIEAPIEPIRQVPPRSRRRAVFGVARRGSQEIALGFHEEGQHTLVNLGECPVLHEDIVAAFPHLREIARLVLGEGEGARLVVTRADNGLDVSLEGRRGPLAPDTLAALAAIAQRARLARLLIAGSVVFLRATPIVTFGAAGGHAGVPVELPQGAFLQAVPESEGVMVELALEALGRPKRVADLFAGLGTFTLAIARRVPVLAVDTDRPSLAALEKAARTQGLRPILTKARDLMRDPLSRGELANFDAVMLDPPRAGAKAQAEVLARSSVSRIAYASCNPATLARDARILIDGGYRLERVAPVDQFLFSPHVEAIAAFRRV
jgi:23S rRNA (uracil1939-C5)-methyltransferase